jgi:hypothetical protein
MVLFDPVGLRARGCRVRRGSTPELVTVGDAELPGSGDGRFPNRNPG